MSAPDRDPRTLARVKRDGRSVLRVSRVIHEMDERSDNEKAALLEELDRMRARIVELERKTGG